MVLHLIAFRFGNSGHGGDRRSESVVRKGWQHKLECKSVRKRFCVCVTKKPRKAFCTHNKHTRAAINLIPRDESVVHNYIPDEQPLQRDMSLKMENPLKRFDVIFNCICCLDFNENGDVKLDST